MTKLEIKEYETFEETKQIGENVDLYSFARDLIVEARKKVYQTANFFMVATYWKIGERIVAEQGGETYAKYGENLLKKVSSQLTTEFGKGFTYVNLTNMRKFYQAFPNVYTLRKQLTWSHYRCLIRVENPKAREVYMNEAADNGWTTRQLDEQVSKRYYERLIASHKEAVNEISKELKKEITPQDFILRDPLILDFYALDENKKYKESDVEQLIIDNLQKFLLEFGKGFSFVARQQRISTEFSHYYIDLVFYNYILKCFVLIDLKIGRLKHQDIGQMDMYVKMYDDMKRIDGDNPTIGIILCEEKDKAEVKYSILNGSEHIFATKYKLYLPTEEELLSEIRNIREVMYNLESETEKQ